MSSTTSFRYHQVTSMVIGAQIDVSGDMLNQVLRYVVWITFQDVIHSALLLYVRLVLYCRARYRSSSNWTIFSWSVFRPSTNLFLTGNGVEYLDLSIKIACLISFLSIELFTKQPLWFHVAHVFGTKSSVRFFPCPLSSSCPFLGRACLHEHTSGIPDCSCALNFVKLDHFLSSPSFFITLSFPWQKICNHMDKPPPSANGKCRFCISRQCYQNIHGCTCRGMVVQIRTEKPQGVQLMTWSFTATWRTVHICPVWTRVPPWTASLWLSVNIRPSFPRNTKMFLKNFSWCKSVFASTDISMY